MISQFALRSIVCLFQYNPQNPSAKKLWEVGDGTKPHGDAGKPMFPGSPWISAREDTWGNPAGPRGMFMEKK